LLALNRCCQFKSDNWLHFGKSPQNRFDVQKKYSSDELGTQGTIIFHGCLPGDPQGGVFFTIFEENRRSGFDFDFGIGIARMT
jgi:hypothetical protein